MRGLQVLAAADAEGGGGGGGPRRGAGRRAREAAGEHVVHVHQRGEPVLSREGDGSGRPIFSTSRLYGGCMVVLKVSGSNPAAGHIAQQRVPRC